MKKCNICHNEAVKRLYTLPVFSVVRCDKCDSVYLDEAIEEEELKKLYDVEDYHKKYFSFYDACIPEKILGDYLDDFKAVEDNYFKQGAILDFGCADGTFLSKLSSNWSKSGIDISKKAIDKGLKQWNYDFYCGDIGTLDIPENKFDVVTMWMVIEHLQRPEEVISKLKMTMKKKGLLVIRTPNRDSLLTRLAVFFYRVSFGKVHAPLDLFYNKLHLFYFNLKSLTYLLEDNGFLVVRTAQDERYVTKHALHLFSWPKRTALAIIASLSKPLRMQDSITVYAMKA
ncbi:MAG: class I SAM-dependent methyltransferase [Candidatus Omnitrophica bacterium]|nr:class I SAM-dependent methyltransferase [Candidatus Omnitrophota bacterium]